MADGLIDMAAMERNHVFRTELTTLEVTEWIAGKMKERNWGYPELANALDVGPMIARALMNHDLPFPIERLVKIGLIFDCKVKITFEHLGTDVTKPVPDVPKPDAV